MSIKSTNSLDKHIGGRVRLRRLQIGMSQEKLAEALGLTFQQVQKYEKGSNRVSASRLHQIAGVLKVDIPYFFDKVASGTAGRGSDEPPDLATLLQARDGIELAQAFLAVPDPVMRRAIINLVRAAARPESETPVSAGAPGRRAPRRSSAPAPARS